MSYKLTKRRTIAGEFAWPETTFPNLDQCAAAAAADTDDYVIEDQRGIVDYRIAGAGPN
jgi:hypothetical protein